MSEQTQTPGGKPRNCETVYRGRVAVEPKSIERGERPPLVRTRISVNMYGPRTRDEDRDRLTEWVDVLAFSAAARERLLRFEKGDRIIVMGPVTVSFYRTKDGKEMTSRTIIADQVTGAAASNVRNAEEPETAPAGTREKVEEVLKGETGEMPD